MCKVSFRFPSDPGDSPVAEGGLGFLATLLFLLLTFAPSLPAQVSVPLGETVTCYVMTRSLSTGNLTNADSTPTYGVLEDITDAFIITGNLVARAASTGEYYLNLAATSGNGFEVGKFYSVRVSATVSSKSDKADCAYFRVVATENSDGTPVSDLGLWRGTQPTVLVANRVDSSVGAFAVQPTNVTTVTGNVNGSVGSIAALTGLLSIPKNTAITGFPVFMRSATDHLTGLTGLTVTCLRSLNTGSGFGAAASTGLTVTGQIDTTNLPGWYSLDWTQAATNADRIILKCSATGADTVQREIFTQR